MNPAQHDNPALKFLRSDGDPPVTVIRDIKVLRGSEGRFELLMGALIDEAVRQRGHLGATVLRPASAVEGPHARLYRFVYKFDSRSNLEAWHKSDTRARLAEQIAELVELDHASEYPGLETWFDLPHYASPPKWKTTLMSWVAIYVLVVALSYVMKFLGLQLPIPVGALILTAVIVPLVAYVVGPLMGKALHGWLHAGNHPH